MRILFAIPHYFRRKGSAPGAAETHASQQGDSRQRTRALAACVLALHQHFGSGQSTIHIGERRTVPANAPMRADVHVVICTAGNDHLLDQADLPDDLYQHYPSDVPPMTLGFECHGALRDRWGNYDYYCFLEDDLIVHDPWWFQKLAWFNRCVGPDKLLQPNRYERGAKRHLAKVYVDGDLRPDVTRPFQDVSDQPELTSRVMGVPIVFRRPLNPHSGCFFLNAEQMQHWMNQPFFLDRDTSFVGPLESAATLGIMRAFKIYKPGMETAGFLEIEHYGDQFLRLIR